MDTNLNFVVKLTTSCPANCKCCTNRQREFINKNENNRIFDILTFEKICIKVKGIGGKYICLSGGEPTIVANIDEYMEIAQKNGLAVRMNTTGWGITEEKLRRWLSLGLEQIVLSVYSLDKDRIKSIRGNGLLLKKLLSATEIIKKMKMENYSFAFIVQTVVMSENYKELPDILEFAIENKADTVWPSYMEDAVNLPEIRMEKEDIKVLKTEIIPQMKKIIDRYPFSEEHKECMKNSLSNYYANEFNNYIYHNDDFDCHWLGKHFTFYPNGTVYPCPGHEYFSSECQYTINYNSIDDFLTLENLSKNATSKTDHCKYCPQGVFEEVRIEQYSS